jgi:hypothetical protein
MAKEIKTEPTFTKENFERLVSTCEKIILISKENINGDLMCIQFILLGENIKELTENPIVKNSGIL